MADRYTPDVLAYLGRLNREPVQMHPDRGWYQVGSLGVWFSFGNTPRPCATYLRGSLCFDLPNDTAFVSEPFVYDDGAPGIALVLRGPEEDLFGTSYPAAERDEAERMIAKLNELLDEQRAWYREHASDGGARR